MAPGDSVTHQLQEAERLLTAGRLDAAKQRCQSLVEANLRDGRAWRLLGQVNGTMQLFDDAEACLRRAIEIAPSDPAGHFFLGMSLLGAARPIEAIAAFQRTLVLMPAHVPARISLANVFYQERRYEEARSSCEVALKHDPKNAQLHFFMGAVLLGMQRYSEAIASYRTALAIQPGDIGATRGMATTMLAMGMADEAVSGYRKVVAADPQQSAAHRALLMALHYLPDISPQQLLREHMDWSGRHVRVEPAVWPGELSRAGKKMRVGYLSPDLRLHSVAYFLEPLLSHHDREKFDVFLYSGTGDPDSVTERFKQLSAHWRDAVRMSDAEFISTVRKDELDILVDLAGHTEGGRPACVGARLAPIQVSYLGYPGGTGLAAMDYRLTDMWADPAGYEAHYCENLHHLAGGFLCYSPMFAAPTPASPPASRNGFVTFGSFNNVSKLSLPTIALWSRILREVPRSRLYLKAKSFGDAAARQRIIEQFRQHDLSPDRLIVEGFAASSGEHLAKYGAVDIALDPFPYNGATTTCEALWMGVPVVTLTGTRHSARVGLSLLSSAGLTETIAETEDDYLAIAVRLAMDTARLATLRNQLRPLLQDSPLCDANRIAREIESAFLGFHTRYRESRDGQASRP